MLSSKKYVKKINKYIENLDKDNLRVEKEIELTKQSIERKKMDIKKLEEKLDITEKKYEVIKKRLQDKGIMLEVENKNNLTQWDNLYLKMQRGQYDIVNKNNDTITKLDLETSRIIKEILTDDMKYSVLVIRNTYKTSLIQIRFIKEEY